MRRLDENTVVLCRRGAGKSCCPVVTTTEQGITISDDYDGKVTLTKEEARMLAEHLNDEENLIHE